MRKIKRVSGLTGQLSAGWGWRNFCAHGFALLIEQCVLVIQWDGTSANEMATVTRWGRQD